MNLAASFALTLTLVGSGLQTTAAQSPPKAEQNALIWSDRDLSLHQGGFDSSPELEIAPRLPYGEAPAGFPDARSGDVLVCEPGQVGSTEGAAAAYAQIGKDWRMQSRR